MGMSKISKEYIQDAQKFEEFKETFLEQKRYEYLKEILSLGKTHQKVLEKFFSASIPSERSVKEFILTSVSSKKEFFKFLQSRKSLKIVKKIELFKPVLELEINKASLKLVQLRDEFGGVDISEEIWNYTKQFIREISEKFWNKFGRQLPKPKFDFIDESTEIRWIRNNSKLVLSITEYFDDIVVYVKIDKGQYFSQPVPKSEIEDWVFFWLNQIWNF